MKHYPYETNLRHTQEVLRYNSEMIGPLKETHCPDVKKMN